MNDSVKREILEEIEGQPQPSEKLLEWLVDMGPLWRGFINVVEPDFAIVKEERSVHGGYGGVGRFEQLHIWYKGLTSMKEWQSMARSGSDRLNRTVWIKKLGAIDVKEADQEVTITVDIFNYDIEDKPARSTEFVLTKTSDAQDNLSEESQSEYTEFFKNEQMKIMSGLRRKRKLRSNCWEPKIKQEVVNYKFGIGAFVIEEDIDYHDGNRQLRYELYVVSHKDKATGARRVLEDHAWEKDQDNRAIGIVNLTSTEVVAHGFFGQKTINL